MSATMLDLPYALDVKEGEAIHVQLDCVAQEGRIVVKQMTVEVDARRDKKKAVEQFLENWHGALSHLSDENVERMRLEHLKEKHLKQDDALEQMIALAERMNPGPLSEVSDDVIREAMADEMAVRHQ